MQGSKRDRRMLWINLATFVRMFAAFLSGLCIEGFSPLPLLVVLYMVLATHVCMVYTSCMEDISSRADVLVVALVLSVELGFTGYALLTGGVNILQELIGFGIVQTLITVVFFLMCNPHFSAKLGLGQGRHYHNNNGVRVRGGAPGG